MFEISSFKIYIIHKWTSRKFVCKADPQPTPSKSHMQCTNMHRSVKWIVCLPLSITLQNRYLYPHHSHLILSCAPVLSSTPPLLLCGPPSRPCRGRSDELSRRRGSRRRRTRQTGKGAGQGGSRRRWPVAWGAQPRR
jgi:hypothetical protein